MRKVAYICSVVLLAATIVGCGSETTTIRRETVRTVPAPVVVEKQTTVRTVPSDEPVVVEKKTTVNRGVEQRTTTTIEEQ